MMFAVNRFFCVNSLLTADYDFHENALSPCEMRFSISLLPFAVSHFSIKNAERPICELNLAAMSLEKLVYLSISISTPTD